MFGVNSGSFKNNDLFRYHYQPFALMIINKANITGMAIRLIANRRKGLIGNEAPHSPQPDRYGVFTIPSMFDKRNIQKPFMAMSIRAAMNQAGK